MASGEFQVRENFCFPSGENYVGTYVAVQRAGETATICSVKKEGALDTVLTKLCGRPSPSIKSTPVNDGDLQCRER